MNGYGSMLIEGLRPAPQGNYRTYRMMLTDPTVAMCLAASLAPVKSSKWMYVQKDRGTAQQLEFIQDQMDRLRFRLVRDMTMAVAMGHQPFEMVWENREGMWGFEKIKPLLPDLTTIKTDDTGNFVGLTNTGAELDANYSFNFAYDDHFGCLYGRSRLENIREHAWSPWLDAMRQQGAYMQKGAGVLTIVHYPQGQSPDKAGTLRDNGDLAQGLLDRMGMGKGIAMPQQFSAWADGARELVNQGIDPKLLMAWQIQFMEHRAGVGSEIGAQLAYLDKLKSRGILVPERTTQEGTTGTRADAQAAGDITIAIAEELNQDIAACVNAELVDELLVQNWGENARGAICVEPESLDESDRMMFRAICKEVLVGNPDLLLSLTDVDGIFDKAGIPKAMDVLDPTQVRIGFDPSANAAPVDPVMDTATKANSDLVDTALNGAQLASMVELINQLTTKQLPAGVVLNMIKLAFPAADETLIAKIVAEASKFKPPPVEAPLPAPAVMGLRRAVRAMLGRKENK